MTGIGKHLLGLAAVMAALALTGALVWYGLFRAGREMAGPKGTLVQNQEMEKESLQAFVLGPSVLRVREAYLTAPDFLVPEQSL